MAEARARPLSAAEAALAATLAYLVLLISLAAARLADSDDAPAGPALVLAGSVALRGAPAPPLAPFAAPASCVDPRGTSYAYARAPGITERLAFGPSVEPAGPLSAAAVNGVLIQRLCGGPETPGGPVRSPDRRLYAAIDAAVNGTDPNRALPPAAWAAGVDRFVTREGQFVAARVVTRTTPAGTGTYGMRVRPGDADPLVVRTRLARADTSRYLVLPVRARDGRVAVLTLRLRCGFQPVFPG